MGPVNFAGGGGIAAGPRRVFVSHTSVAAVVAAVLRARHAVTDVAYFAATPAALCVEMVARSEVYVGIIGLRYDAGIGSSNVAYENSGPRSNRSANHLN